MNSLFCPSRYRRPSLLAWICFLSAFFTLMALGFWQLDRLAWKEELIAKLAVNGQAKPLRALPTDSLPDMFQAVIIKGTFGKQEFHVTPRYYNDVLGYHLFVPFTLDDGRHVMVNRGWVPAAQKELASRPESATPKGKQTLRVQVREGAERHTFTPESQPEKNVWFGRDITRMGKEAGIDVLPYSVDVLMTQKSAQNTLPIPSDGTVTLRNDHLNYAITWFLIGLAALIIFTVFHRKDKTTA